LKIKKLVFKNQPSSAFDDEVIPAEDLTNLLAGLEHI
jgi:hypothetical protein